MLHNPTIVRMTPFKEGGEGAGVAAVTLGYGPVVIRAKLSKSKDGGLYLQLPSRKSSTEEKWYDQAYFIDTDLKKQYEDMAIQHYNSLPPVAHAA